MKTLRLLFCLALFTAFITSCTPETMDDQTTVQSIDGGTASADGTDRDEDY